MAEKKEEKTREKNLESKKARKRKDSSSCQDNQCPFHGNLRARGRIFKGSVIKKFPRRIVIEFEKIVYVKKYERQMKKETKLHARLPDCLKQDIDVGDYVEVQECRPLSKIIHFVVLRKIKSSGGKK